MHRLLALLPLAACSSDPAPGGTGSTPTGPTASLDELSFFQAVEVPVVEGRADVPTADRKAPLIVDRQAILRGRVSLPVDWTGDALELAVDLTSDGTTETFSATADPDAGIVVDLPAEAMGADTTWVVRLSEGGVAHDRFPDTGAASLDALPTGPLKLHLVPFEVAGFVPDTSAAVVEGYRAALMAVYPVTEVQITVGAVEVWDGESDLGDLNVRVGELQEQAMVAGEVGWDVYFYGMATGVATREAFDGITGTSEGGSPDEAPVRAYFATGAAFGDQKAEDTLIHEIGHTHRLLHTPCDGEDDPDPDYPYDGGSIGVEGYDFRTDTFVPADSLDMMAYCYPRWISDYNYAKLATHVANAQDYAGFQ